MKRLITSVLAVAVLDTACAQETGYGEAEFMDSCAVCHGSEGKGGADHWPKSCRCVRPLLHVLPK